MLHGVVVERRHVVDVRHGEGDDVVVVRVVDVDAADLDLTRVQEELPGLWKKPEKKSVRETKIPIFFFFLGKRSRARRDFARSPLQVRLSGWSFMR